MHASFSKTPRGVRRRGEALPRELTGSAVSHHILKANCLQRDLPKCVAMNMASFLMGNSWRLLLTYCFGVASCCVHRCKFHKNKGDSYPILTQKGNHLPITFSHSRETIFLSHPHTQGKLSSNLTRTRKGNHLPIHLHTQGKTFSYPVLTLRSDYLPIPSLQ